MNPQAIMTPGGIADQLTHGLSGVAMAFQRRREQDAREEQRLVENEKAQQYLMLAQRNAQTGETNQRNNFARQERIDLQQVEQNKMENYFSQQKEARERKQFAMDESEAAMRYGYGAGEVQQGMSPLAQQLSGGFATQSAPTDRFPVQNEMFRNRESIAAQLAQDRGYAATTNADANRDRAAATKAKIDRAYNGMTPAIAVRAITNEIKSLQESDGFTPPENKERVEALRVKLHEFQSMPAQGGLGVQAPAPLPSPVNDRKKELADAIRQAITTGN